MQIRITFTYSHIARNRAVRSKQKKKAELNKRDGKRGWVRGEKKFIEHKQ